MNQNVEEIRQQCKTKTSNEARREVCVTRIDEVDDVEEEELGARNTTRKHCLRQPSEQERIEHEMTHLPFRSWSRQCIKGRRREEDCRKANEEERQVPEVWTTCTLATKRNGTRWHCWWPEEERRELYAARWFRGSRRENGYVEGRWHGFVKLGCSL